MRKNPVFATILWKTFSLGREYFFSSDVAKTGWWAKKIHAIKKLYTFFAVFSDNDMGESMGESQGEYLFLLTSLFSVCYPLLGECGECFLQIRLK